MTFYLKEQRYVQDDKFGNKLYMRVFFEDDTNERVSATIHLQLAKENKRRLLGNYYFRDSTFYVKRDSSRHYHRVTKSYGFNHTILNDPYFNMKFIMACIDGINYKIPKSVVDEYGTYLHFKEEGFELQKFLKFQFIKNYLNEK